MEIFKKGDLVVIKDWDEMVSEFGYVTYSVDEINCLYKFTDRMKHLCGEVAIVKEPPHNKDDKDVVLEFPKKKPGYRYSWMYSTDMIRLYEDDVDYDTDETSLINFVTG